MILLSSQSRRDLIKIMLNNGVEASIRIKQTRDSIQRIDDTRVKASIRVNQVTT